MKLIQTIEKIKKTKINNIESITKLIRETGLSPYDPKRDLYGSERIHMNSDAGICQHPEELSQMISLIIRMKYKNMLEIGSGHGWTSVFIHHVVSKFIPFQTFSIDKNPKGFVNAQGLGVEFLNQNSWDGDGVFDVVFIDADHSYDAVSRDFNNYGKNAKMCAFHDIDDYFCPGVKNFWDEIKIKYINKEFISNQSKLGIGVCFNILL
jgi:hypothetical protein